MRKSILSAMVLSSIVFGSTAAFAGDNSGKVQIKVLGTGVLADGKITSVVTNNLGLPATSQTDVTNSVVPTIAAEYFFSPNVSVETICCVTPHNVRGKAGINGAELINNAIVLPATITVKYHLPTNSGIKPYVGAGPAHFFIFSEDVGATAKTLGATRVDLSNSFGVAVQAGIDIPLNDRGLGFSVDAKKYWVNTTASFYAGNAVAFRSKHKIDPWVISTGFSYRF